MNEVLLELDVMVDVGVAVGVAVDHEAEAKIADITDDFLSLHVMRCDVPAIDYESLGIIVRHKIIFIDIEYDV
jgi:uncharacterized metal-binding protein